MKGCLFHHSQCLTHKICEPEIGLATLYKSNGKNFNFHWYCNMRLMDSLALLPPTLVAYAWNLVAKKVRDATPRQFRKRVMKYLAYHKKQWISSYEFICEWNHYRAHARTNNPTERAHRMFNDEVGCHPYLFKFVFGLAKWHQHGFGNYEKLKRFGFKRDRDRKERLRADILDIMWNYIDVHQEDKEILFFLSQTAQALKQTTTASNLQKLLHKLQRLKI